MLVILDQYSGKIGPHTEQIKGAIDEIKDAILHGTAPAYCVGEKLLDVADAYQEIIENNYYGSPGTQSSSNSTEGTSTVSGCFSGGTQQYAPGIISPASSMNSIQSISNWINNINPHYGNPFFPQSKVNCGSCAFAVERRLNGDSTATASLTNIGTDEAMEMATGKKCVYMSVSDIERKIKDMGPGSHLIVGINRRLPNGKPVSGHWFNAFYDGNKIYTIDGQNGAIYEWPHDYGYISEWCALV